MVDRRPAIITRCASPADVAAAVRFGRAHDLELGVRCGGHSVLGISVPAGGLMVDLTPMQAVRVDPERRRAWVQGGSRLRNLDRATQPFGLATTAGNVSHTGVGGLTLGGGMGWLARWLGRRCCIQSGQGALKQRPTYRIRSPRPVRRTRRSAAGSLVPRRPVRSDLGEGSG
jgi:FAD/FMN-containing dehydrogenase